MIKIGLNLIVKFNRRNDCANFHFSEGRYLNDAPKIFGLLDPLPLVTIALTQPISTIVRFWANPLSPLPPQCGPHKWKPPKRALAHLHHLLLPARRLCLAKCRFRGRGGRPRSGERCGRAWLFPEAAACVRQLWSHKDCCKTRKGAKIYCCDQERKGVIAFNS